MRLGRTRPGDLSGTALYTIAGHWVVTVSRYVGWESDYGHRWQTVPAESIFRLDVLRRQLQAAGIQMSKVEFRDGQCLLVPASKQGRVAPEGGRIKRFMNRNYGTIGSARRPVSWTWDIRQYG